MTNPDLEIFTYKGHGRRMDQKKADDRAAKSYRWHQYWRHRSLQECVDCGSQDAHTLDGYCRCFECQKRHTDTKRRQRQRERRAI